LTLGLAACGKPLSGPPVEPPSEPPVGAAAELPRIENLVLVSIDTLRADHLGCYGNTVVETPNMDRLAREGVLFTAHTSSAPTTLCSHTSLMTGTYPHTHGTPRNGFKVPAENLMLAEVLHDAGFRTAGVIGAFPLSAEFGFAQGFDTFDEDRKRSGGKVNEAVRRVLESRSATDAAGRFFLFVHYWDVHYPYDPPPPYDRRYRTDDLELKRTRHELAEVRKGIAAGEDESQRNEALRGLYAGEVSYVDAHVGELLAMLEEFELLDRSLIVLTSDHGESMDEHWEHWDHGESTYEVSVHTPLILRLPGTVLAGSRHTEVVGNVDVMPTVLDLLGIESPGAMDGTSFADLLAGEQGVPRPPVFAEGTKPHAEETDEDVWLNADNCRTIRAGNWKLVQRTPEDELELYDLARDPGETNDLLATASGAPGDLVRELTDRLEAWSARVPRHRAAHDLSEEALRQLESLGYTESR